MIDSGVPIALPWISDRLGHSAYVLVRDPDARAFFEGMPDQFPLTECYAGLLDAQRRQTVLEVERWVDQVLGAAIVDPPGATIASHLGPDRTYVVLALFRRWGWVARPDGQIVGLPGPNFRRILRTMARSAGVLPSELMKRPVNEFIFDFHVLIGDALKRRAGGVGIGAGRAINDAEDAGPSEVSAEELGIGR